MFRLLLILLLFNFCSASSLQNLLEEYEDTSKNSLQTLNEKMGHARIYSQKELKLMQYDKLSEVLKELPITSLNRNALGVSTLSLVGTKADATGFFRLFINDHEVSSAHTQSPFLSWYDLPVSLIDYIEVYYGEGSFTLGNETGIEFIRVYTKKASKENGANLKTTITSKSTNSQEISYATVLENGWSYFAYFANQNNFFKRDYNKDNLDANSSQQYVFLDIGDGNNSINVAYTTLKKDNYRGLSFDSLSDDGETSSNDFFINYSTKFLRDKSLKFTLSVDVQNREYKEENKEGISIPAYFNPMKIDWIKAYEEDIKLTKTTASLSKEFKTRKNNFFTAFNIKNIKYDTKNRKINNTKVGEFYDFNEETSYSLAIQDDYKILDNLILIGNFKVDKYHRNGYMEDSTETLYRIGSIYLPTKNLGFKTFYTISHIPPSFYNTDFSSFLDHKIDSQKYKYFTFDTAYTYNKSRISLEYFNVHIDDYIYHENSIGFINIDHTIKTNGFIFDYLYNINKTSKVELNYFSSQLTENENNYTHGGYFKYMQSFDKFSYFASVLYRKGFTYMDLDVDDSFDLNLGATYNFTKNLSFSLKAANLLDKSTQSIINGPTLSLIDDYDREISFSLNWRF